MPRASSSSCRRICGRTVDSISLSPASRPDEIPRPPGRSGVTSLPSAKIPPVRLSPVNRTASAPLTSSVPPVVCRVSDPSASHRVRKSICEPRASSVRLIWSISPPVSRGLSPAWRSCALSAATFDRAVLISPRLLSKLSAAWALLCSSVRDAVVRLFTKPSARASASPCAFTSPGLFPKRSSPAWKFASRAAGDASSPGSPSVSRYPLSTSAGTAAAPCSARAVRVIPASRSFTCRIARRSTASPCPEPALV